MNVACASQMNLDATYPEAPASPWTFHVFINGSEQFTLVDDDSDLMGFHPVISADQLPTGSYTWSVDASNGSVRYDDIASGNVVCESPTTTAPTTTLAPTTTTTDSTTSTSIPPTTSLPSSTTTTSVASEVPTPTTTSSSTSTTVVASAGGNRQLPATGTSSTLLATGALILLLGFAAMQSTRRP